MTCTELQDSVNSGSARAVGTPSADILSHLESCSACRDWVEIEQRLTGPLQVLRNSVPTVPATLDESVLNAYRAQLQHASSDVIPLRKPVRPMSNFVWRASVAALLLAGAILLFGIRRVPSPPATAKTKIQSAPIVSSPQAQTPIRSEAPKSVQTTKAAVATKKRTPRAPYKAPAPPAVEGSSTEAAYMGLPPDFRNLMYCDQLSCSGAMEVIRMNLPASSMGLASPSRSSNVVAADVVVGPDGVARAIRIVN
jgi:hypothetical protein